MGRQQLNLTGVDYIGKAASNTIFSCPSTSFAYDAEDKLRVELELRINQDKDC